MFRDDSAGILFKSANEIGLILDIIFLSVKGNKQFECIATWGHGILHTAQHVANQDTYCALSDHMTSSKI